MRIYELSDASSFRGKFVYAYGYGPLATPMPFLHPAELARRQAFWEISKDPPGLLIEGGGSRWPDVLACGDPSPPYFVSQKIVDSLRREKITLSSMTEMPIATKKSKKLIELTPNYFAVQAPLGIEVDFAASNIPTDIAGSPILNPLPKPWPPILKLKASSWSGLDIFSWSNFRAGLGLDLLCTDRIVELAKREGWTNVRFDPIEAV